MELICQEKDKYDRKNYARRRRTMAGEGGLWQEKEDDDKRRRTMAREQGSWQEKEDYGRRRRIFTREGEL